MNMGAAESSVTAFFGKLADTWNTNDGTAFAGFFTEDGSLINPFGERADGRAALTAMYTEYFGGMLHGTTTSINLTTLRAIGMTTRSPTPIRRSTRPTATWSWPCTSSTC